MRLPKLSKALFATDELASRGALLLARALAAAAPGLKTLELNGNALSDAALEQLEALLPAGVLGEMDDNDEDLADGQRRADATPLAASVPCTVRPSCSCVAVNATPLASSAICVSHRV